MTLTTRTKIIRTALGLSQQEMAVRLGVSQPTIFRLEQGQKETGPISLLLNAMANSCGIEFSILDFPMKEDASSVGEQSHVE